MVLAAILSLSIYAPVNSYGAAKFSDASGHWAESYINEAVRDGFVGGYPDGKFRPDKAVTRAEFATMINKALGNSGTANVSFYDVNSKDWYYTDVSKAVAAAYTAGYSDGSFKPDSPITRQEAAVMLSRIVSSGRNGNLNAYSDNKSIADWAYEAMAKVNGKGYIGAYNDGMIHPLDRLTRAQTAKIICEIIDNESIVTGNTTVKDDGTKLSGKIYVNNVTIHKDLGEDSASIENSVILGNLYVYGGGPDTVTINNTRISGCIVSKGADPVRLLAKGETSISDLSAEGSSILQTSGLTGGVLGQGFSNINVKSSAEMTLRGNFPRINVIGTKAKVILNSGTISELTIAPAGKYSDITAESGTSISNATVNAESYFHGTGTISHMAVNASNITYETKPKNWTIAASVKAPTSADPVLSVTFNPKNGATKVKLDAKVTLTFGTAMEMYNGSTITSSNIKDIVTIRKGSSTGSKIGFSASINSSKKEITITPDSFLSSNTKYYVTLEEKTIRDGSGNKNSEATSYFTTGDEVDSVSTTYSPADGATGVSVNPNITLTFSEAVSRYNSSSSVSSSYLRECLVFRKKDSGGADVPFSASISSSNKVITITPDKALDLNQKYYVAVVSKKLQTSSSKITVPASSVTWTTGVTTPVVDALTLTPGSNTITANVTSNINGTAYLVVLPSTSTAVNATQVVNGQNASNVTVASNLRTNGLVSAGTVKSFTFSGLDSNTGYTVYVVVNANSINSAVKSASATTAKEIARLSSLEVIPTVNGVPKGNQISFNESTLSYNVTLNTSITTLRVNAAGSGNISINADQPVQFGTYKDIELTGSSQTVIVIIERANADKSTYSINVDRTDNPAISSLTVTADGTALGDTGGRSYMLTTTGAVSVTVSVAASDQFATVIMNGNESISSGSATFNLDPSTSDYSFSIRSGSRTEPYTIQFKRPANPPVPTDPPTPPAITTPPAVTLQ